MIEYGTKHKNESKQRFTFASVINNVKNLIQLFHRDSVIPRLRFLIVHSPSPCSNKCLPKYVKPLLSFTYIPYITEV